MGRKTRRIAGILSVTTLLMNTLAVYGEELGDYFPIQDSSVIEGYEEIIRPISPITTAPMYVIDENITTRSAIEMIQNPFFDEGLNGWENPSWASGDELIFSLDEINGVNGGPCAKVENNAAIEQTITGLEVDIPYRLKVKIKGVVGNRLEIGVETGVEKVSKSFELEESFQEVNLDFITGAQSDVRIYAYAPSGTTGYVDDFSLELGDVPVEYGGRFEVDPQTQYQTFDGWGTSLVWFANVIGGWKEENREGISDLLFDQESGLGLNIVRYNIGGGDAPGHDHMRPGGEMEGFATGFDSQGNIIYDWDADANQIKVLKDALVRGVDITEAFSNTPPYFMTESGCASGSEGGWANNLRDDYYNDFATYLVDVVEHFKEEEGIVFDYLEPLNEPYTNYWKANGGQEGCHFDVDKQEEIIQLTKETLEVRSLDKETVVAAMDESVLDTGLDNFKKFSIETRDSMEKWNVHTYGGSKRKESKNAAAIAGKDLWMSEVDLGGRGNHNPDSIGPALDLASRITYDMQNIQPTAWCIWQAVENWPNMMPDGENSNWGLILANFEGEGAGGLEAEAFRTTKKYYAMMQYSKFIRPGAVMLESNDSNTLSFYDKEKKQLVVVVMNDWQTAHKEIDIDLTQFQEVGGIAEVYRTSQTKDCIREADVSINSGTLRDILDRNSITTYVINDVIYDDAIIRLNESTINDEEEANRFVYSGDWGYDAGRGYCSEDNVWASQEGDQVTLHFSGQRAQLVGAKAPNHGIAKISVDDKDPIEVDLYAVGRLEDVVYFDTGILTPGNHTVVVEVTGAKNERSSGAAIPLDYAKIYKEEVVELNTSFKPGAIWSDTKGERIQAHGGGMWYDEEEGKYYWYGEDKTHGYRPLRGVRCYTSTDLYNWEDQDLSLEVVESVEELKAEYTDPESRHYEYYEDKLEGKTENEIDAMFEELFIDLDKHTAVMERPKVIYNEKTDKWVMWFHADGPTKDSDANYAKAKLGVAISDDPSKPFTYLGSLRLDRNPDSDPNAGNQGMGRDMNLFVDDDGTGYVMYSSEENGTMYISKLTDDYLDVVGWHKGGNVDEHNKPVRDKVYQGVEGEDYVRIFNGWAREAPAMFKYDSKYYLITSGCTGWAPNQAKYAIADNVFGPWEDMGDPCINDWNKDTFYSQSTYVIPVDEENGKFIYMGDRWTFDGDDTKLADSRYIWLPIQFESDGKIGIEWYDEWDVSILDKMGKVEIITEMPDTAEYGRMPELPTTIKVSQGGVERESEVAWDVTEDTFKKVGEITVGGTLETGEKVTVNMNVVPNNVLYFINCGDDSSKEYMAVKEAIGEILINKKVVDQALTNDNRWGYTGATSTVVDQSGIYESLRYVNKDATNRNIEYTFRDLEPGKYSVYLGFYDPWAQWANGNRKANILINDVQKATNLNINGDEKTYYYGDMIVDDALKITIKPVNTGNNSDVQISWLMIAKEESNEVVIINAPSIQVTPEGETDKVVVELKAAEVDGGSVLEYKVGEGGEWTTYTEAFEITENTTIYGRATDGKGIYSEEVSKEITNIKEEEPEEPVVVNAPSITVTPEGATDKVKVTITPAQVDGGSVLEYKVGADGEWVIYTEAFEITQNTTVYARATDGKGIYSEEIQEVIDNIKDKPSGGGNTGDDDGQNNIPNNKEGQEEIKVEIKDTQNSISTIIGKEQIKALNPNVQTYVINMVADRKLDEYDVILPSDTINEMKNKDLRIQTDVGDMIIPAGLLKDLGIKESQALKVTMSGAQSQLEIGLTVGGSRIDLGKNKLEIAIPYDLSEKEQDKEALSLYILDDTGKLRPVYGKYKDGKVIGKTRLQGMYIVRYNPKAFEDLDDVKWAESMINTLAKKGIINGITENKYDPTRSITRGEFVELLVRAMGIIGDSAKSFVDVPSDKYYAESVGVAKSLGIVNGTGDGKFNPTQNISRQDMMVIIASALHVMEEVQESATILETYKDADLVAGYAQDAINLLLSNGIVIGNNGYVMPTKEVTRAEVASVLFNILER